jgi:hypothetical protein
LPSSHACFTLLRGIEKGDRGKEKRVLLFLSGAEMQPERVRAAWPEARFLARARLEPQPLGALAAPDGTRYERWGILIEAPGTAEMGETCATRTDDSRPFAAVVLPPDEADPTAVLAAARYWELPPPYVRRLARIAAAPVEEYFY